MGPPLGGVLFEKLGFRAPFILSIAFAVVDLIGRLLVIEKAEAVKWLEKDKQPEVSPPSTQGVGGTTNVPPLQMVASEERAQPLSVIQVVIALCKNRKAITAFIQTFCCGCVAPNPKLCEVFKRAFRIAITAMEPTLPLRLQEVYGYTSLQVGFIFMVADVPTLFGASLDSAPTTSAALLTIVALPLSGWLSGRARGGPEWTSFLSLLLSIPWWMVMTIRGSIALFATSLALSSGSTSSNRDHFTQCRKCSSSWECSLLSRQVWRLQRAKYLGWAVRQHSVQSEATSDRLAASQTLTYSAPSILHTVSQAPVGHPSQ